MAKSKSSSTGSPRRQVRRRRIESLFIELFQHIDHARAVTIELRRLLPAERDHGNDAEQAALRG